VSHLKNQTVATWTWMLWHTSEHT